MIGYFKTCMHCRCGALQIRCFCRCGFLQDCGSQLLATSCGATALEVVLIGGVTTPPLVRSTFPCESLIS